MHRLVLPTIAAFTSASLALGESVTVTTRMPVEGDSYQHHSTYEFEKTTTMEFAEEGQPREESPGPGYLATGEHRYKLEALTTAAESVSQIRAHFAKIQDTYVSTDPESGDLEETEEVDNNPGLAGRSIHLDGSGKTWRASDGDGEPVTGKDADLVLGYFGLDSDRPPELFPPEAPLTEVLSSQGDFALNKKYPLGEKAAPVLAYLTGFEINPTVKASGTITHSGNTQDKHPIFKIRLKAEGQQPHDFFEGLRPNTKIDLDYTLVLDKSSNWPRTAELTATTTATYPMGIQGVVWTQTDTSTQKSKSEYNLTLKK